MSEHRSDRHPLARALTVAAFTAAAAVALVAPTLVALHERDTSTLVGSAPVGTPAASTTPPPSPSPSKTASQSRASADLEPTSRAASEPATSPPLLGAISRASSTPRATSSTNTAALARDHWSTLPKAPIAAREDAAVAWTGIQMLIWGGETGVQNSHLVGDGAAYDPATKVWMTLPAAPLTARAGEATAWTGNELFLWGGYTGFGAVPTLATDGALYNPQTHSWRRLPASPLKTGGQAQAIALSGRVYVITMASASPEAAVYDPGTNRWSTLPDPPATEGHLVQGQIGAVVDDGIDLWQLWSHTTPVPPNGYTVASGIDALRYDPATRAWSAGIPIDTSTPDDPDGVQEAIWTGDRVLLPTPGAWCGGCTGGLNPHAHGYQWINSAWAAIPQGPVDEDNASYLWTGQALLGYDTGSREGPAGNQLRGGAAAWDPATNRWTTLPDVPLVGEQAAAVWTGSQLLEWGDMYDATKVPAGTSPVAHDAGLSFGP